MTTTKTTTKNGAFTIAEMVVVLTVIATLTTTAILHLQAMESHHPHQKAIEIGEKSQAYRDHLQALKQQLD